MDTRVDLAQHCCNTIRQGQDLTTDDLYVRMNNDHDTTKTELCSASNPSSPISFAEGFVPSRLFDYPASEVRKSHGEQRPNLSPSFTAAKRSYFCGHAHIAEDGPRMPWYSKIGSPSLWHGEPKNQNAIAAKSSDSVASAKLVHCSGTRPRPCAGPAASVRFSFFSTVGIRFRAD